MNKSLLLLLSFVLLSSLGFGQDPNLLRPPKGAQVALIVFQDLECPKCRSDNPVEESAAKAHKIPLVLHDFPLPGHPWSFQAAVIARYFDTLEKDLGNQFRDFVFQHQLEITRDNLTGFAQRFAGEHHADLPYVVDPQGKLAALVNADKDLGNRIGVKHTPTIYIVTTRNPSHPFLEVEDTSKLFQMIEAVQSE